MEKKWLKCPKMSHQEWMSWRREGIGGSDAPAIMGVSPWSTPYETWENKVLVKSDKSNSSMERGKSLEEAARRKFEDIMGVSVVPLNALNVSREWLRCSLDGLDMNGEIMVEIKCPNKEDHAIALDKKVPDKYYPQCQHQLAVMGLHGMYYFSFDGVEGTVVEVARDQKYIDNMLLPKETEFWDLVQIKEPPALTDRDYASMEGNLDWLGLSEKWKETKRLLENTSSREKELREQLIALSKGRNSRGHSLTLSKSICKGNIDYDKLMEHLTDKFLIPKEFKEQFRKDPITKFTLRDMSK